MKVMCPVPMTRRPVVSVVIPHYNYGQYLPTAVDSARNQTGIDLDIIIVDDHSTDGSLEVAKRIADSDDRVTLIEHPKNLRHIRTYNDGLSRAEGDYVVLLSADDALAPDSLTRAVGLMEAVPSVGLVYGRVEQFDEVLPEFNPSRSWWQVWQGDEWIARVARRGRNVIMNPEAVMRRSVYREIGGYDVNFPHAGDMLMWLEAAARSDVGFVGGPRQAYYRDHGANMHSVEFGGVLDDMAQVRDVYEHFFNTHSASLSRARRLTQVSRDAVRREALLRGAHLAASGAPRESTYKTREFAELVSTEGARTSLASRWFDLASDGSSASRRAVEAVESFRWRYRSRRRDVFGF